MFEQIEWSLAHHIHSELLPPSMFVLTTLVTPMSEVLRTHLKYCIK